MWSLLRCIIRASECRLGLHVEAGFVGFFVIVELPNNPLVSAFVAVHGDFVTVMNHSLLLSSIEASTVHTEPVPSLVSSKFREAAATGQLPWHFILYLISTIFLAFVKFAVFSW